MDGPDHEFLANGHVTGADRISGYSAMHSYVARARYPSNMGHAESPHPVTVRRWLIVHHCVLLIDGGFANSPSTQDIEEI